MITDKYTGVVKNKSKRWQLRHREQWLSYCKKRNAKRRKNPILWEAKLMADRLYQRKRNRDARKQLLDFMGGQCVECGYSDYRALQVDHVYGDGAKQRKKYKSWCTYSAVPKLLAGFKNGTCQLLCANCNWIKRVENHENWRKI